MIAYKMEGVILDTLSARSDCDAKPSPTGAKMLMILELLTLRTEGITSAEAARESGFTQNLVYRLLRTLVEMGYAIQREEDKAYVLTQRLMELSAPRRGEKSLARCAHEALRQLRDETGETVQLLIEADDKAMVLEQCRGTHAVQVSGEIGMRVPMYSCAPGKAIMAAWNSERLEKWYEVRESGMKAYTATTLSTRSELDGDLEVIRERGYSLDLAEGMDGIHCVSVAIMDSYGQPVGAVTVMVPMARLPKDEFPSYAEKCARAAARIESNLRY